MLFPRNIGSSFIPCSFSLPDSSCAALLIDSISSASNGNRFPFSSAGQNESNTPHFLHFAMSTSSLPLRDIATTGSESTHTAGRTQRSAGSKRLRRQRQEFDCRPLSHSACTHGCAPHHVRKSLDIIRSDEDYILEFCLCASFIVWRVFAALKPPGLCIVRARSSSSLAACLFSTSSAAKIISGGDLARYRALASKKYPHAQYGIHNGRSTCRRRSTGQPSLKPLSLR